MKNSKPNCPLYIEKEKVTVETTNQNKLPSVQWRNKQNNSPVGYTGHCLWKEILSQQRIRHFDILRSNSRLIFVGFTLE